jgi:hypothetical protein
MGFLDKAKKMAEQAQTKLDDVQKQFNESQGASQETAAGGAPIEYDKHGRPVTPAPEAAAPPPPPPPPAPEAAAPPPPPAPEAAAPPPPTAPPSLEPRPERDDEYAPPKLSSGDPLEG